MSRRQDILAAFVARLEKIQIAEGYQTDAGQLVFIGERPVLGPDDPTASIMIDVRDDEVGHQGEHVVVALPVSVRAVVKAGSGDPWLAVEAVLADIKTAVEADHDLGGILLPRGLERASSEQRDREAGDDVVGAAVGYVLRFRELW